MTGARAIASPATWGQSIFRCPPATRVPFSEVVPGRCEFQVSASKLPFLEVPRGRGRDRGEYLTEGDAPSFDSVQDVRLLVLLQDLVMQRGRTPAADVLGVNYKTVGIIESGRLTRRVA